MQLWLSAEAQHDISEELRQAQLKVKREINSRLAADYGAHIKEWALISIIRPEIPEGWGEVWRFDLKDQVPEFRLIIPYDEFKAAMADGHVRLLLKSILRSVDIFPILRVKDFDVERFRRDIMEVARSEGWLVTA